MTDQNHPAGVAQAAPVALQEAAKRAIEWFESDNFVPIGYSRRDIGTIGPITRKVFDDLRAALAAQPSAAPVEFDTLAGARKQAMEDHASMLPAAPVETNIEDPELCWHSRAETEGELVVTQYELAAAQTALREIANMSHNCRSVEIAKAFLAGTQESVSRSSAESEEAK